MNITTHGGTTDASDKQPGVVTIGSKDLLAAVENLRSSWADIAYFLEEQAKYQTDICAQLNAAQARVIRKCISDLYQTVEAANDRGQR
jgi:hypothetical protein